MKEQLEQLKAELREFIALSKTVTPGKWEQHKAPHLNRGGDGPTSIVFQCHYRNDAAFIARSRNTSPAVAECLLVAVEGLEYVISCYDAARFEGLNERLQESEYGVGTLRDLVERRLYYSESEAMEKLDQIINLWNLK
jgi:hypothetical protein